MGIQVELRKGRRWWYVVVDFGDGTVPVSKGPMTEAEAKQMAEELEAESAKVEGVVLREKSVEEEERDRFVGLMVVSTLIGLVITFIGYVVWAIGFGR